MLSHAHSDDSHVHATVPCSSCSVTQVRSKCHPSVQYCHSLGNWIGLSAAGLKFIQAS